MIQLDIEYYKYNHKDKVEWMRLTFDNLCT